VTVETTVKLLHITVNFLYYYYYYSSSLNKCNLIILYYILVTCPLHLMFISFSKTLSLKQHLSGRKNFPPILNSSSKNDSPLYYKWYNYYYITITGLFLTITITITVKFELSITITITIT
jgi:hypothetical protein